MSMNKCVQHDAEILRQLRRRVCRSLGGVAAKVQVTLDCANVANEESAACSAGRSAACSADQRMSASGACMSVACSADQVEPSIDFGGVDLRCLPSLQRISDGDKKPREGSGDHDNIIFQNDTKCIHVIAFANDFYIVKPVMDQILGGSRSAPAPTNIRGSRVDLGRRRPRPVFHTRGSRVGIGWILGGSVIAPCF